MKSRNPNLIRYGALVAGLAGCVLYTVLFTAGLDEKGLPVLSHWSHRCLWVLTGLFTLILLPRTRFLPESSHIHPSISGAAGCLAAAAACFLFPTPTANAGSLATADMVLRGIAGACLCIVAYCRFAGKKPLFLFHGTLCLYFAFRTICQYRFWSADPQIVQYCFYLGAYVALILTGYHFAARDADCGSCKALWVIGLCTVYLCGVSLAGPEERIFMLCCLIWVLTNLPCSKPESQLPEEKDESYADPS